MRRYETIYILRPTLSEEQVNTLIENTNAILTEDAGTIIKQDKWGLKKFAYLIKKESQGHYIYCDYATNPAAVTEMERRFRIEDAVLKFMTVKLADAITEEEVQQAIGDVAAQEAAAKEAEAQAQAEEEAASEKTAEA